MTTSFFYFLAYIAVLVGGGYAITRRWEDTPTTALMLRNDSIDMLTKSYNLRIGDLEREYDFEREHSRYGNSPLKSDYSDRYRKLVSEYKAKVREQKQQWAQSHPQWVKARKVWGWVIALGFGGAILNCMAIIHQDEIEETRQGIAAITSTEEVRYWNAQNIPIPYLQDSTQYVSNPDGVLSQDVVDSMNVILRGIEDRFDIQTVVAVVNHIENDDPYRMAQDLGNSYGVGRHDRGLVIVVGYGDHSINISPGRSLEADLTDAECHRLQQRYVIPAMRAEKPDSAMLYLTRAIYAHMQQKELPKMSSLLDSDEGPGLAVPIGLNMAFMVLWFMFYSRLNRKYQWMGLLGATSLVSNPFYEPSSGGGGGFHIGGGGGGFGGGGGGFSGGSFGGGSFGGGGATSRW